jgi:hypothetical protein
MNEIYGVDPSSPKDLKDLKALFTRFGLAHGRFISRYPSDWERDLFAAFSEISELDRARLTRLIQLHQTAFLTSPAPFNRSKTWARNVAEQRLRLRTFDRILAKNPNEENLETLEDYLWGDDDDHADSRGAFVEMTPESYAKACAPLFECSSEVHLSDRFFQLRNQSGIMNRKRWAVLRALVGKAVESAKCRKLFLHFEVPPAVSIKSFEMKLEDDLEDIANEFSFEFSYDTRDVMHHGRYIFSIHGGLQFDHGFEITYGQKNHVHWLSSTELNHLHVYYGLATRCK